ncbi:hypothetical protein LC605_30760 [Nostoc sp. CHAB 5836]|uniref:hypothetical protein n=1 Tax=Nostoc sp. CHAB 5836 TaxID=2780404 RepID=UPI001E64591B|nr:hypothetical protein [Nostoc sp. CHAB 5836]MCC5619370.1 hypothetical protein [Nostoc sp. CHAB 5836]
MNHATHTQQAIPSSSRDKQATVQAEVNHHLATQAQAVAPRQNPLTNRDRRIIGEIIQVIPESVRTIWIEGGITVWVQFLNGGRLAFDRNWFALRVQEVEATLPEEVCPTENAIMCQIFNECEKYGFEILDDGIYNNDVKLGEVGCTNGSWWVMRIGECQQLPCDSAMSAVWWLSMVDTVPHVEAADFSELLDRPFDELTIEEWQRLREYEPAL